MTSGLSGLVAWEGLALTELKRSPMVSESCMVQSMDTALDTFQRAGIGRSGRTRGLVDGQGRRARRGLRLGDPLGLDRRVEPGRSRGTGAGASAGHVVLQLARILAAALLVLGVIDYALRYRRFEAMLRTTTQEQREDRRVIEGDPAARAQRRRISREFRAHSPDVLTGASLILGGTAGLTLVLGGGPPPRRVTIRTVAKG